MRLCVLVVLAVVVFTSLSLGAGAAGGTVAAKDLHSLMLGPGDIPWDVIVSVEDNPDYLGAPMHQNVLAGGQLGWAGPPIGGPNTRSCYGGDIACVIYDSAANAGRAADKWVRSFQVTVPESRDKKSFPYADRAWIPDTDLANTVTYVRKNVVVRFSAMGPDGDWQTVGPRLAAIVSRKIDAAAAGKPEPAARVHPFGNWYPPGVYKSLARPARNTILFKYKDRLTIPAFVDSASSRDCLVRLEALMYAVSKKRAIKVIGKQVKSSFAGHNIVFTDGSPIAVVDGKNVRLSRAARIVGPKSSILRGAVVPLSLVEKVFGWHIRWVNGSKIKTAVIY